MKDGESLSHQNEARLLIDKREEGTYCESWQNVNLICLLIIKSVWFCVAWVAVSEWESYRLMITIA